jgi:CDP-diacylglycerol--glycerol-3-phosphate 3-phosphatidyltransferase
MKDGFYMLALNRLYAVSTRAKLFNKFRDSIDKVAFPIGRSIGKTGVSPNFVTVLGTVLVGIGCFFVIRGQPALGAWILVAGGAADLIDGAIAKSMKAETKKGAFLDSTTDRLSDGVVFATVVWISVGEPLGLALALVAMVLGFLVSYIKARAEALGFSADVGIAERAERVGLIAVGLILNILIPMLILLVAISLLTVVQRFVHVYLQARRAKV